MRRFAGLLAAYAREHELLKNPDNLSHCTLLHDRQAWSNDSGTDEWLSWAQHFAVNMPPSSGIGFDRSDLAIIAAINHVGVAMGESGWCKTARTGRADRPVW
jgi:LysR family D-serine deaminase transcriptional activator